MIAKNNQCGSSLLEALAVISVIAVLSISALSVITNIYNMFKQSMATSEIRDIQRSISGIYNFSGDYKMLFQDDPYKILCEEDRSIPNQMCLKSGSSYKIKNRLSGNVTISPSADMKGYLVKYEGLSRKNCLELAEIDWLDRKRVDLYQLDINDTPVAFFPKKGEKGFPIATSVIFSSCSKSGKNNSITWHFY